MLHLSVLAEPGQTSNKLFKLLSLPSFIRIEDQMIYPTWSLRRIIAHEWKNCFLNSNRTLANIALTLYGTWINGMQRCDIILKLSVNNHFFTFPKIVWAIIDERCFYKKIQSWRLAILNKRTLHFYLYTNLSGAMNIRKFCYKNPYVLRCNVSNIFGEETFILTIQKFN